MKPLEVPKPALGDDNAIEMIRAWLANRGVHVALNIGLWDDNDAFEEEQGWGCLLADIVYHVANAIHQKNGTPPEFTRDRIREFFLSEVDNPSTGHRGSYSDET